MYLPVILYIEDNPVNADVIMRRMRHEKVLVIVAESGEEGIWAAMQHHPEMILVDFQMPDLDGIEVTRRLRRMSDFTNTPIVMLTADMNDSTRRRAYEAGVNGFLTKPLRISDMQFLLVDQLGLARPS